MRELRGVWVVGTLLLAAAGLTGWLFGPHAHAPDSAYRGRRIVAVETRPSAPVEEGPPHGKPGTQTLALPTLEMCGLGALPLDVRDPSAVVVYLRAQTAGIREHWQAALSDSRDYRARAAGLYFQSEGAGGVADPGVESSRTALAELALGTGDPAVYAFAAAACERAPVSEPPNACSPSLPQAWAEVDRDSASPWLFLAAAAHATGDVAGEARAFEHAASARTINAYDNGLFAVSEPSLPRDATPLERWYLAQETTSMQEEMTSQPGRIATGYCSADAVQRAEVRRQCAALAELFVAGGRTLRDAEAGADIAARVGWSAKRLADLADERVALREVVLQASSPPDGNPWSCEGVERGNAFMSEWLQWGQLGAAREALNRSDKTVRQLVDDFAEQIRLDPHRRDPNFSPVATP